MLYLWSHIYNYFSDTLRKIFWRLLLLPVANSYTISKIADVTDALTLKTTFLLLATLHCVILVLYQMVSHVFKYVIGWQMVMKCTRIRIPPLITPPEVLLPTVVRVTCTLLVMPNNSVFIRDTNVTKLDITKIFFDIRQKGILCGLELTHDFWQP